MIRLLTNRWIHFLLLFVLLLCAVFNTDSQQRWRQEMQYLVFDELNALYPREPTGEVLIVDIDDDSLLNVGQWEWPRTKIATLVTNLTALGAKVVAFDGVLAEPDRTSPVYVAEELPDEEHLLGLKSELKKLPDHDTILAQAIKNSGIFVSAFTYGSYTQTSSKPELSKAFFNRPDVEKEFLENATQFKSAAVFLPELESVSAGNGSFMANPDSDGVLRKAGMIFTDGQKLYPSLGLEVIRVAQKNPLLVTVIAKTPKEDEQFIDTSFRIKIGGYEMPIESNGLAWLHYRKFDEKGEDYLSAYKVIMPEFHDEIREQVKNKIVLIGSSAEGLKDLRSTALEPFQPGVEIHANIIEQILQGDYLLRPDLTIVTEAVYILFAGLAMIVLAPFINALLLAFVCFALIVIAFIGSATAYVDHGLLLDPFYPSLSVFLIFIVSTLLTYLRVEIERKQVRGAFGMYVSPDVMKDLEKNPENLQLGGENKDLTVMFTDIRKFTTISEGLTPEELINLMNDFLTAMSDIVLEHGGTIDKYMGDAMMAFWNAPKDVENHERQACLAALKMQKALEPINDRLGEMAEAHGTEALLLHSGIGLNTGRCSVGNMGSHQRFAYSALGDAVNLASRLEGQTKNYGVDILIGEDTQRHVPHMATLEMDLIRVKGKKYPVRVYALLGDEALAKTKEFQSLQESHREMIENYQQGNFKEAQKALKICEKLDIYNLYEAYELYEERLASLIKTPPEDEWDGVYKATTK